MCLGIPGRLVEIINDDFRAGTVEVSGVRSAWPRFPARSPSVTGSWCMSASPSPESTNRTPSEPWPGSREWARPTPTNYSHSRPAESMPRNAELPVTVNPKCGCASSTRRRLQRYAHYQHPELAGNPDSHHQSLNPRPCGSLPPPANLDCELYRRNFRYKEKARTVKRVAPDPGIVSREIRGGTAGPGFFYRKRQCTLSITATRRREPREESFSRRELPA